MFARVVANRGEFYTTTTTAAANSLRAENRKFFTLGGKPVRAVRVVYAGFYITTLNVETNAGNSQVVESGFELVGAPNVTKLFTFDGGAGTGTIADGAARYISDWLYASQFGLSAFPANSTFFIRDRRQVTLGQIFPRDPSVANMTGEGTFLSDGASSSQVNAIGVMTTQTGGSTLNRDFGPVCIEGLAASHDIAVLADGDSLLAGVNDTNQPNGNDGTTNGGFVQRGLKSVNGRSVPILSMAYAGTQAQQFVGSMTKRAQYFPFCTHMIENFGTNDFAAGARTAAQIYADRQTIWTAARAAGVRWIEALPIFPRATSTDSWATLVNQTPSTGYATTSGVFRDPMNALLATALSQGLINGIININTVAADAVSLDKWVVTGAANYATADGTHPTPALSALLAPVLTARAQNWV